MILIIKYYYIYKVVANAMGFLLTHNTGLNSC